MNEKTARWTFLVGTMAIVAVFALWKDVPTVGATVAVAAAGVVFVLVDARSRSPQVLAESIGPSAADDAPTQAERDPGRGSVAPPTVAEPLDATDQRRAATLDDAQLSDHGLEVLAVSADRSSGAAAFRIAKHGHDIDECEDAVRIDLARHVVAVADGASSSFGAGPWARVLVDEFVASPPKPLSPSSFSAFIERCRAVAASGERDGAGGWWSEEGERRGAFATLVGAATHGSGADRVVTVMCVGDSCGFILGGARGQRQLRVSIPYEDASQFGSHPSLVGSLAAGGVVAPSWTTLDFQPGELLVLASDAVSEWLLGDPRRFARIDAVTTEELSATLIAERSAGNIVNDDLTMVWMPLA